MDLPIILYENKNNVEDLENLKKIQHVWKIYDIYENQLSELFEIIHPYLKSSPEYSSKRSQFIEEINSTSKNTLRGNWIYFPWNGNLVHAVNEQDYLLLRTNRNRNLITKDEQQKLYDACIGIAGLSVGSSLAVGLAYQGIGHTLKLAEFDTLETTNLNRIKAGIHEIGVPKIDIVSRQIYEIDPYCKLDLFPKGLTKKTLSDFVNKKPSPKVIFEIIDDFEMKIHLRVAARNASIPVVTPANLGDSILLDIERYDINKNLPLFNGVLGNLPEEILNNPDEDKNKYAVKMVGIENVPKRALQSVQQINKTLVGRPQLSSTVAISAALASYLSRRIILGQSLPSGRSRLSLDQIFKLKE